MSETVWENQAVTSNIFWQENISFLLSRRQSCHKGILVEGYQAQSLRPSNISAVHSSIQCMQAQWASRASLHELQNNQLYTYFGRKWPCKICKMALITTRLIMTKWKKFTTFFESGNSKKSTNLLLKSHNPNHYLQYIQLLSV